MMFIRKRDYLMMNEDIVNLTKANGSLKRELHNKEKELDDAFNEARELTKTVDRLKRAIGILKRDSDELRKNNAALTDQLMPKPCDGCIHADNYRKCASCARYPKIKDKYEER